MWQKFVFLKRKKPCKKIIYKASRLWAHLDLNQGPTDYESVALTNFNAVYQCFMSLVFYLTTI